ncbi:colanic acid/amylovoran biosynthesis glycosyltransferase [Burkholderiales bacterium]|nr:MAG: glycosyltransferase family 4 protein [Burkholderiales bacterium]CAG1010278.1 colanic acid/amylovoran biosynthesis glycosyltransferase [Burkholderiales bacterium]
MEPCGFVAAGHTARVAAVDGFWHYSGVKRSVVFLNSTFPCLSETFVFDQFEVLRESELDLVLVANHRPEPEQVHPRMRAIQDEVHYLNEAGVVEMLAAHTLALFRHPWRYLRSFIGVFLAQERLGTALKQLTGATLVAKRFSALPHVRLHAHFTYGAAAVARWTSALTGLPYGLTLHGSDLNFDFPPDLEAKLRGADLLVSISRYNIEFLAQNFPAVRPARLEVIGMGVPALPPPVRTPRHGPFRILNVGRLSEHKAQHHLIDACALLAEAGLDFRCDIVGEGPARPALEALIARHHLEGRVRLLGPRFHDEVLALYGDADLFVLCSIAEGMPIVLMEAMRAGVPVIATAITAIPELVRDAGLLVPAGDVPALAHAIRQVARDEVDVAKMIVRGRAIIAADYDLVANHRCFGRLLASL